MILKRKLVLQFEIQSLITTEKKLITTTSQPCTRYVHCCSKNAKYTLTCVVCIAATNICSDRSLLRRGSFVFFFLPKNLFCLRCSHVIQYTSRLTRRKSHTHGHLTLNVCVCVYDLDLKRF